MKLKYIKNAVNLKIDRGKCTGCSMCINVCPHDVFKIEDKKALVQDIEACMECGACRQNCPSDAIEVKSGVGCAYAIIQGFLRNTEPDCGCSKGSCCT